VTNGAQVRGCALMAGRCAARETAMAVRTYLALHTPFLHLLGCSPLLYAQACIPLLRFAVSGRVTAISNVRYLRWRRVLRLASLNIPRAAALQQPPAPVHLIPHRAAVPLCPSLVPPWPPFSSLPHAAGARVATPTLLPHLLALCDVLCANRQRIPSC